MTIYYPKAKLDLNLVRVPVILKIITFSYLWKTQANVHIVTLPQQGFSVKVVKANFRRICLFCNLEK